MQPAAPSRDCSRAHSRHSGILTTLAIHQACRDGQPSRCGLSWHHAAQQRQRSSVGLYKDAKTTQGCTAM